MASDALEALEALDDFSYWDSDGSMTAPKDSFTTLDKYLGERYHIVAYQESLPFLILECDGAPPDDPPFSVAGAIVIWTHAGDGFFWPVVGGFAYGEDIEVEDGIIDQSYQTDIPSKDMILHLANLWPECQAITLIWDYLVMELPLVSKEHHLERLQDLPKGIDGGFMIRYNNGPLVNAESSRAPELNPGHAKLFRTAEHKLGDLFLVDYAAGVTQTVCYFGRRFTFGRRREAPDDLGRERAKARIQTMASGTSLLTKLPLCQTRLKSPCATRRLYLFDVATNHSNSGASLHSCLQKNAASSI